MKPVALWLDDEWFSWRWQRWLSGNQSHIEMCLTHNTLVESGKLLNYLKMCMCLQRL